jgi:hypothetical protein
MPSRQSIIKQRGRRAGASYSPTASGQGCGRVDAFKKAAAPPARLKMHRDKESPTWTQAGLN